MQLFENLFAGRGCNEILEVLSNGLTAVLANASRLIKDVSLLIDAKRYASAAFLLATADEEMAKSYILVDACRLDFLRHQSVLKCLCRAFYNHIAKHAYNQIVRSSIAAHDMRQVKEWWDVEVTPWWPSDPESGEPDMPHDVYFAREMPLYVEFNNPSQKKWAAPEDEGLKYIFEEFPGNDSLTKSRKALDRLCTTSEAGLCKPDCLSILNETFRDHYITERTEVNDIFRLYKKTASRVESETGIPNQIFSGSALDEWPLYHFVSERF
jgi:AbiV family abortive infection protein